ncbi:MAG: hypothetical protein AAFV86_16140 [Pseudomonadota bacterium]
MTVPEAVSASIAIRAPVFAVASVALGHRRAERSAEVAVRPVLVLDDDTEAGWQPGTIGNGPALTVIVAQKEPGATRFNPQRVPPVGAGARFTPAWPGHVNATGLGATYEDIFGTALTSVTGNDLTTTREGRPFGPWPEGAIAKHWNAPPAACS